MKNTLLSVSVLIKKFSCGDYIVHPKLEEIDRDLELPTCGNSVKYFEKHFSDQSKIRIVGLISTARDEYDQGIIVDGVSRLLALKSCLENGLLDELLLNQLVPLLLLDGTEEAKDIIGFGFRPKWQLVRRELNSSRIHIEEYSSALENETREEYEKEIDKLKDRVDELEREIENSGSKKKR